MTYYMHHAVLAIISSTLYLSFSSNTLILNSLIGTLFFVAVYKLMSYLSALLSKQPSYEQCRLIGYNLYLMKYNDDTMMEGAVNYSTFTTVLYLPLFMLLISCGAFYAAMMVMAYLIVENVLAVSFLATGSNHIDYLTS